MSKEITPLEALDIIGKALLRNYDNNIGGNGYAFFEKEIVTIETALKREESIEITAIDIEQDNQALCKENKKLKRVLENIKECIGLKMSVDEDIGCLYIPITKCFQPLEQNIVVVGCVKGKDKIDLLKEVLK